MRRSAQALRRLGVVADVVVGLGHADVELGVRRHLEGLAGLGGEPLVRAVELVLAGAGHAFHDLGSGRAESQLAGQHHAGRLLRAIGQREAMADAFAVEIDIGLGGQGDARDGFGGHGSWAEGGLNRPF